MVGGTTGAVRQTKGRSTAHKLEATVAYSWDRFLSVGLLAAERSTLLVSRQVALRGSALRPDLTLLEISLHWMLFQGLLYRLVVQKIWSFFIVHQIRVYSRSAKAASNPVMDPTNKLQVSTNVAVTFMYVYIYIYIYIYMYMYIYIYISYHPYITICSHRIHYTCIHYMRFMHYVL